MTTDSNVVIKQDLNVKGENWNLAMMMTAKENVTIGSVISLCNGHDACVGYGLAETGFRATSQASTDIKVIHLSGANHLAVMYYRKWVANGHQSQPMMRLIKPWNTVNQDYGDPIIGDEIPVALAAPVPPATTETDIPVSEFKMATITDLSFLMVYRKAGGLTATNIQGAIRLGEITSVEDNTLVAAAEVLIPLVETYGFRRGIPIRLAENKFAIAWEHTNIDTAGAWLGTASIAIGNIGGGSAANRGVTIGSGLFVSNYVSDLAGASFNDNKNVVLVYREQNALKTQDRGMAVLVDTKDSVPKIVTTVMFNPVQTRFMDIVMVSQKSLIVVYREPKRNFIGKGMLLNLVQSDSQLVPTTPTTVADESSIENSYALSVTLIRDGQLALAYRNGAGRPRLVDCDVVGASIVVGTPRVFVPEDHVASSYQLVGLTGTSFMLVYQDDENNLQNVATTIVGSTYGGALRTGVATSAGTIGQRVQVAIEGAVTIPIGTMGAGVAMEPGARYYGRYDGGVSSSSDDGVLLGRALRTDLLLLERDFAGGFRTDDVGKAKSGAYVGEIKALAGATIPAGWLPCDGAAVSRIDYSSLFAALGTKWGVGDGSSTFNVPELRGRSLLGSGTGPSLTARVLAQIGGKESMTCAGKAQGPYHSTATNYCLGGTHQMNPFAVAQFIIKT